MLFVVRRLLFIDVLQEMQEAVEKSRMRVAIFRHTIEQLHSKKTAMHDKKTAVQICKAPLLLKFRQCCEFLLVRIGKNNFTVRKYFNGAVKCRLGPFRALGDGADFAVFSGKESYNLGSFGEVRGTYANSCVFGQHLLRLAARVTTRDSRVRF